VEDSTTSYLWGKKEVTPSTSTGEVNNFSSSHNPKRGEQKGSVRRIIPAASNMYEKGEGKGREIIYSDDPERKKKKISFLFYWHCKREKAEPSGSPTTSIR